MPPADVERAALLAQGLHPHTIWLPDTATPEFHAMATRACAAIDRAWEEDQIHGWIGAMLDDVLVDLPPPEGWD